MPITSVSFKNDLLPGLYAVSMNAWKEAPKMYEQVSKPISADKGPFIEEASFNGFGLIPEKVPGAPMDFVNPSQGFIKRYTPKTYAAALSVEQEAIEDSKYGAIMDQTRKFGNSAVETVEVLTFDLLNSGFATHTTEDAAYVFSASHLFEAGGSTWSNLGSSLALSEDNLWTAINAMRTLTDNAGNIKDIGANIKLWVPIELDRMAREILSSEPVPHDDANTRNVIRDFNIQLNVSHYLTSSTAWFLQTDDHSVKRWMLRPPTYGNEGDFMSTDSRFRVRFRYTCGVTSGWGLWGTAGS